MNKILFLSLFCSYNLMAASSQDTVILLESLNHRGVVMSKEVVMINGSKVIVNGENLSPAEIITQSKHIIEISTFLSSTLIDQCVGGKFRHFYKKSDSIKEEIGCLNSERFNNLNKSFKALKKDHITQ